MARSKGRGPAARQAAREKAKNQAYLGPKTTDGNIPHTKASVAPQQFYGSHVKSRMPVVLHGQLEDLNYVTKNWGNIDYLHKTAGNAHVKVEPMHKEKRRYGTDVQRVDTTFGAFLDSLKETKDEYDYLTTQYSDDEYDEEEEEEDNDEKEIKNGTFPEPVRSLLQKDVPMRPALMGNLVLQQMNLWLGKSKTGASSGLHHDFHDNLYVLIKGRKRFVLYPPSAVEHLNTFGQPKKIHSNGLIVYKQPGEDDIEDEDEDNECDEIRPDGLVQRDAAALKVQALEQKINSMKETGKKKGLDKLEAQYEEAVDQMMKYQLGGLEDMDDDDSEEEDEEEEELRDQFLRDDNNSKKRKADEEFNGKTAKAAKVDVEEEDDDEESSDEEGDGFALGAEGGGDDDTDIDLLEALENAKNGQGPSEPLSFSQIPTQELHQHLGLNTPAKSSHALEAAGKPYIVELKAGDMLYLPTSWFHEVTSFSDEGDDVHIALNYWFHPPDAALQKFESPYDDVLLWKFMEEKVKAAYDSLVKENAEK